MGVEMNKVYSLLLFFFIFLLVFASCSNESEIIQCSITLDYDGTQKNDIYTVNQGETFTIPDTTPKKEGYIFCGWKYNSMTYYGGRKITVKSDMVLKAIWVEEITVTFMNGDEVVSSEKIKKGSTVQIPKTPQNEGYKFEGWYLGENKFVFSTKLNSDTTLVAKWTKIVLPTYTVSFNTGDDSIKVDSQSIEQGSKASKPESITKSGYNFVGWFLNNTEFDFNNPITKNITLTAKWEKIIITHTVSFNTDGGSPLDNITVEDGDTVYIMNPPTKSGFTLIGWTLDGVDFDFYTSIKSDITLVAKWAANDDTVYKVTVDYQDSTPSRVYKVKENESYTFPETPSREGYSFKAWKIGSTEYQPKATITISSDTSVSAVWIPIYTVTIDYKNGTENEILQKTEGSTLRLPDAPEREGYTFKNWKVGSNTYAQNREITVTDNITVTAIWNEFTVTFDTQGGTAVDNQIISKGGKAVKPSDPQKEGYYLYCWTTTGGLDFDFDTVIDNDITLVARWVENGKYPVIVQLSLDSYEFPADEDGIVKRAEYEKFSCTVNLSQKNKLFTKSSGYSTTNGTFYITAETTRISFISVSGNTVKTTSSTAMLGDSASIIIHIYYQDFDGVEGEVQRVVTLTKKRSY